MRFVLCSYAWNAADPGWEMPAGGLSHIDLRSLPQREGRGGPAGLGLMAFDVLPPGLSVEFDFGDDPHALLAPAARNLLADALRVPRPQMPEGSMATLLADVLLGSAADPAGLTGPKPLRLTQRGARLRLRHVGELWSTRFDPAHPMFERTLAVRRADYARARALALSEAARLGVDPEIVLDALRRWNDFDAERLGVGLERLVPGQFLSDGHKPHQTDYTEAWPSEGDPTTGQNRAWVLDAGTPEVASGKLTHDVDENDNIVRCTDSLSSDDQYHYGNLQHTGEGTNSLGVRKIASSTFTMYVADLRRAAGTNVFRLRSWVAGTPTTIDSDAADPGTSEQNVWIQAVGSEVYALRGPGGSPTAELSATDTAITGHLQVAWFSNNVGEAHTVDLQGFGDMAVGSGGASLKESRLTHSRLTRSSLGVRT